MRGFLIRATKGWTGLPGIELAGWMRGRWSASVAWGAGPVSCAATPTECSASSVCGSISVLWDWTERLQPTRDATPHRYHLFLLVGTLLYILNNLLLHALHTLYYFYTKQR